jgi:hypothetical protein
MFWQTLVMGNASDASGPIVGCVERWHRQVRGEYPPGLDGLLHDDCVFVSPIVFTPQRGKAITKMYLTAAGATLGGGGDAAVESGVFKPNSGGPFRYVTEVLHGNHAMLEFETEMNGVYVNGVDIITCDDDGMITEFKVMIRPLQAVNLVHAQMKSMLELMSGRTSG